ncbi:MAG: pilus assembly protein PilP [Thermodesulfovibrionales bacterium]
MRVFALLLSIVILTVPVLSCKKKGVQAPPPKAQKVQKVEGTQEEEKTSEEPVDFNPPARDPFSSLILKAKQADVRKPKGLHRFEDYSFEDYSVDEFKLIAIVWNKADRYAMVTVPDGKSYTIKEGMTVGIHNGKVVKIEPKAVHIREFIKDYKGVERPRDVILKLREEE